MESGIIRSAEAALAARDPVLGRLIASQKLKPRIRRTDYFEALSRSIIGQQVSVAAAHAIFGWFQETTGLEPLRVTLLDEAAVKQIGLSRQKAGYVRDLAQHFVHDPAVYNHLENQPDEVIIRELTAVKGIGVWTAQMFMMFTLGRPDIFAPDDVGLQRGMAKLYGWTELPKRRELEAWAERWKPYRTVASLHLWQSLDNVPEDT
jgi:DNA-3-methyladenine glycosylase II